MVIHVAIFSDCLSALTKQYAIKMPVGFSLSFCRNRTTNCQSIGYRSDWGDDDGTLAIGLTEVALTGMT